MTLGGDPVDQQEVTRAGFPGHSAALAGVVLHERLPLAANARGGSSCDVRGVGAAADGIRVAVCRYRCRPSRVAAAVAAVPAVVRGAAVFVIESTCGGRRGGVVSAVTGPEGVCREHHEAAAASGGTALREGGCFCTLLCQGCSSRGCDGGTRVARQFQHCDRANLQAAMR